MSTASTPGSAPKSMSSRLLTMKFMQRAAATPTTSPSTPEEPSPKRRKKDSDASSRPSFDVNELVNQRAIEAAAIAEDAKRQAALERAAAESGDTRWVLSFEDQRVLAPNLALRVVQTGYANLDSHVGARPADEDLEEDKPVMVGRRSFGKFNKILEKKQGGEDESESESSSDDEEVKSEEEPEDDDPTSAMIKASRRDAVQRAKAERKAEKHAEKLKAAKLVKDRKKKKVNLNSLTSISGTGGGGGGGGGGSSPSISCYSCGGNHTKANCPRHNKRGYPGGGEDGPSRKAIKTR